mgnify:CR=1 FL=1
MVEESKSKLNEVKVINFKEFVADFMKQREQGKEPH